jgi:PAS domain S-box-containing protein
MRKQIPSQGVDSPAASDLKTEIAELKRENTRLQLQAAKAEEMQNMWQHLMRVIPLQILYTKRNGEITFLNKSFSFSSPRKLKKKNIFEYIPPEHQKQIQEILDSVFRSGRRRIEESRFKLKDGSVYCLVSHIIPIKRANIVDQLLMITQDITEQKKAEAALRENEEKFRTLAEQSPNMIFINQKGRVVYVNRMCEQIMGFTKAEFLAPDFDFLTLIAPESLAQIQGNFARHMRGEEIPPYEYSLVTKSAKRLEAIITTRLIQFENDTAVLGIVTDISERKQVEQELEKAKQELEKRVVERTLDLLEANRRMELENEERTRAEAALRSSEAKLRSILDSSPDAITVTDVSGNIVDCNQAALDQRGARSKQEMLKKNSFDLIAEEDRARAMRNLERTLQKGSIHNIEYRLIRDDGTSYPVELSASVIKDPTGNVSGFVAVTKDITERKASELALLESQAQLQEQKKALEQKNIALGEIIAQVEFEKQKIIEDIAVNVRKVIMPTLDLIDRQVAEKTHLDLLRHHLEDLTSTYGARITAKTANLTRKEIEICNMIKAGLSSKDISQLLKISTPTVEQHRKNIRRKFDLTNTDVNLSTFLRNLL